MAELPRGNPASLVADEVKTVRVMNQLRLSELLPHSHPHRAWTFWITLRTRSEVQRAPRTNRQSRPLTPHRDEKRPEK